MKSAVVVASIVGIMVLVFFFSHAKTGALVSRFCSEGTPVFESVPGGGLQVVACVENQPVAARGAYFQTYETHPQGDLRRQRIASRGFLQ